ncbi:MAG: hypothetical protein SFY66_14280 [Oculatellaceae cyanobacterium bins.114]|nr:hypothetical protein [Oculatellaceae cyanobacterium bins.114]
MTLFIQLGLTLITQATICRDGRFDRFCSDFSRLDTHLDRATHVSCNGLGIAMGAWKTEALAVARSLE